MTESTLVVEGEKLVAAWESAKERVERLKGDINRAECELANATTALGAWMTPKDAKIGEQFCVWHGSDMLTVTKTHDSGNGTFTINVRSRGKR